MMIAKSLRIARCLIPAALVAVSACDDNGTNPGGGLSGSDRAALIELLGNPAVSNAIFAGGSGGYAVYLPLIASNLQSMGTLDVHTAGAPALIAPNGVRQSVSSIRKLNGAPNGSYRAFGGQFVITSKMGQTTQSIVWTGIIAVNNLSNPTDIITTGVVQTNTTTPPSSIPQVSYGSSGTQVPFGSYIAINGQTSTVYNATTGNIAIAEAAFGSSGTNCTIANFPMLEACNFRSGTLEGNFNFTASRVGGSGTVTIPATTVNVPAVRYIMTINAQPQ